MTLASRPVSRFRITPRIPGDKSITHRAWLIGALAEGETRVRGWNPGADCAATLRAVQQLGVTVRREEEDIVLEGSGGRLRAPARRLDLGNSGTGLRLLLGVLAGQPFPVELAGDASLNRRPVERVLVPLREMGATATTEGDHPPVFLTGGMLRGLEVTLPVPSAQAKSAVLLAGIQARGETRVHGGGASRDHTERMLRAFSVPVEGKGDEVWVRGPATPRARPVSIPGDPSAATFYLVAAAIAPGSEVVLEGIGLNPSRIKAFEVLERMGLTLERSQEGGGEEPQGRVTARGRSLQGLVLDSEEVSGLMDELPALAVAAAFADGVTTVRGAGELKVKESDRLVTVAEGLRAIGAKVTLHEDGWTIEGSGGEPLPGGEVLSRGDHRVAMAFLIAGLGCRGGVRIGDNPMIETSDPLFMENLNSILDGGT